MIWDRIAARYGCLPAAVSLLTLEELEAALDALIEAERIQYVTAAYPVWLERAKKGLTFTKFVASLGLARDRKKNAGRSKGKMTKAALADLHARAAAIRAVDLKR